MNWAGGILDEILKRLANQVEKDSAIHKKIRSAMAYPIVIMCVTIVAFFGIMLFIIPKIAKIFKDLGGPNAQLPVYTRAMLQVSDFMVHNILFILVGGAAAIFGFRHYIRTEKGKSDGPAGMHGSHWIFRQLIIKPGAVIYLETAFGRNHH